MTDDEITADDVYQQMKNYADPQPDSMKKFMDDLDKASKDCNSGKSRKMIEDLAKKSGFPG